MYQSRYHYENELLSVAIDSLTGELLELIYKPTGENFIKNSCFLLHQPFQLFTSLKGEKIRLFGGDTYSIARDAQLKPHITHDETENALRIQVSYDKLTEKKATKVPSVTKSNYQRMRQNSIGGSPCPTASQSCSLRICAFLA